MTLQPTELQALINEIDGVLSKASPRLPWVMSGDVDHQRRLLEQTRNYLVKLQQQPSPIGTDDPMQTAPLVQGGYGQSNLPAESAQQVLQSVLQEMSYLRSSIMQPMRTDVEALRQERETLLQEVRQLEAQKQQGLLPNGLPLNQQQVITEFLQALMGRMQETLSAQVGQMLTNAQVMALQDRALSGGVEGRSLPGTVPDAALTPTQRLEQLQSVQAQSDQLLLKLDSTLQVFFESLQRNVQSYQDSLNEGLSKMHNLGQQGEAMFAGMINRLAQQLGRELQASLQASNPALPQPVQAQATTMPPLPGDPLTVLQPDLLGEPAHPVASEESPLDFLGTDFAEEPVPDDAIDQLLAELRNDQSSDPPPEDATDTPPAVITLPPQADLSDLNLLNLELDGLDLETSDDADFPAGIDEDLTFLQDYEPEEVTQFQLDDEDLTFLQVDEEPTPLQEGEWQETQMFPAIANLDSAVELLNQLNLEAASSAQEDLFAAITDPSLLTPSSAPAAQPGSELDDFYESLFGDSAPQTEFDPFAESSSLSPLTPPTVEFPLFVAEPPSDSTAPVSLEAELFEGFADPSVVVPAEVAAENALDPFFLADETPLTLESLLFDEPPPASEPVQEPPSGDGDWLVWDGDVTLPTDPGAMPGATTEVISPLSDLAKLAEPDAAAEMDRFAEDSFEQASPDETLLAADNSPNHTRLDVSVDSWTLEQLQQDLSRFEENLEPDLPLFDSGEATTEPEVAQPVVSPFAERLVEPEDATLAVSSLPAEEIDRAWDFVAEEPEPLTPVAPTGEVDRPRSFNPTSETTIHPQEMMAASEPAAIAPPSAPIPSFAPSGNVAAALPEDFLSALLGDVPTATEVPPPALDVTAVPVEETPAATLPPSREDLTLEDYQAVMSFMPPVEAVPSTSPQFSPPAVDPFPLELSAEDFALTIDLFADQVEAAIVDEKAGETGDRPLPPDNIFSAQDWAATEPAPSDASPDNVFSLEDFEAMIPAPPVARSFPPATSPAAPEAFTLEGLDRLFEDLPPTESTAPNPEPASNPEPSLEMTLDNLFGADFGSQASLDLYTQPPNDPAQKKSPRRPQP